MIEGVNESVSDILVREKLSFYKCYYILIFVCNTRFNGAFARNLINSQIDEINYILSSAGDKCISLYIFI